MAKFTVDRPIKIRWSPGFEISGDGATYRIPDSLVEEFQRDVEPAIAGTVTWITQDEASGIPSLPLAQSDVTDLESDLSALGVRIDANSATIASKFDKAGGIISGATTVTGALTVDGLATFGSAIANAVTATSIDARDIGGVIYADQYSSIQAAIAALPARGGSVFISAGAYTIGTAASTAPGLTYPVGDSSDFAFQLIGAGAGATRITYVGTGWAIDTSAATAEIASQMVMQGISFVGTTAALSGGLRLKNVHRSRFRDLQIQDFNGVGAWGILIDGTGGASLGAHHNLIEGCDISGCTNGVKLTGESGLGQANANRLIGNRVSVNVAGGTGVLVDIGDTNVILGTSIFTNANSCTALIIGGDRNMAAFTRCEASTATGTIGVSVRSDATLAVVAPLSATSFGTESVDAGTATELQLLRSTNGGRRVPVATYTVINVAASATATVVPLAGTDANGSTLWVPLINASIAGISWRWSANVTAGTYSVNIARGGVTQQTTGAQSARIGQLQFEPGELTCSTAQSIGITVDTSGTFSPTTNDLTVFLWAYA